MNPTISDEQVDALKEEKADLLAKIKPIIKVLSRLDRARGKYILKLIDLRARYAVVDRELAEGTKVTIVNKKNLKQAETVSLAELLKDPAKAKQLMDLLKEVK